LTCRVPGRKLGPFLTVAGWNMARDVRVRSGWGLVVAIGLTFTISCDQAPTQENATGVQPASAMVTGVAAQPPSGQVRHAVLRFRNKLARADALALASRHGLEVKYVFHGFNGALVAYGDTSQVLSSGAEPSVSRIEFGSTEKAAATETQGWGYHYAKPIGSGFNLGLGASGSGVSIAIVDSGIDCNHPDILTLYSKCAGGFNFISYDGGDYFTDLYGHGTAVASVADANANSIGTRGGAYSASLYSFRVLDSNGNGNCVDAAAAVDSATVQLIDVINMSLRWLVASGDTTCDVLHRAIQFATGAGLTVVAAAGNDGGPLGVPAKWPEALTVSALSCDAILSLCFNNAHFAGWSSFGPQVDLSAAGESIAILTPTACSTLWGCTSGGLLYRDGTSFAAPLVSAAVAILISHYPNSRRQVEALTYTLRLHSYHPQGYSYDSTKYGAGILDIGSANGAGSPCNFLHCFPHPDP
jgi:subtilisin family serine protease